MKRERYGWSIIDGDIRFIRVLFRLMVAQLHNKDDRKSALWMVEKISKEFERRGLTLDEEYAKSLAENMIWMERKGNGKHARKAEYVLHLAPMDETEDECMDILFRVGEHYKEDEAFYCLGATNSWYGYEPISINDVPASWLLMATKMVYQVLFKRKAK